jgi:FixJ family two-component response regulator
MGVKAYGSGDAFLRALKQREPDCLILDIRMPAMTGPELRQQLLDTGYDIPIVFITAHAEDVVTERRLRTNGIEILRKPFDNQALLDAIQRAIERRKPR